MWNIHAYSGTFMHIQTYPDIIRHIQTYSGIIQVYSEPCVTLAYSELWRIQNLAYSKPEAFRTLVYLKLWHIQNKRRTQNPGLFRTLRYSEPEEYSEPCETSTMERFEKQLTAIILLQVHNISFACTLVHEKNMIF